MSLRERAPGPAGIDWISADGSTRILISAELADQIAGYVLEVYKSVPRRGAEAGGLLTGTVRLGPVTAIQVTGFDPVLCEHRYGPTFVLSEADDAAFRTALSGHAPAEILGYCRSHTRKDFGLEASDRQVVESLFPGRSGVILLIKPVSVAKLTAQFFFFQGGRLDMQSAGPLFLYETSVPGGILRDVHESDVHESEVRERDFPESGVHETRPGGPLFEEYSAPAEPAQRAPLTAYDRVAEPLARRKRLQWEVLAAGVMIAAALGLLYWQYHREERDVNTVTTQQQVLRVASLGLNVQPGEGGWRITWDTNSLAARAALHGALQVAENESQERIPLTGVEVHAGAVTYRPTGDDITFRLELTAPDDSVAAETYRVIRRPQETVRLAAKPKHVLPRLEPKPVEKPAVEKQPAEKLVVAVVAPEVQHRVSPTVGDGIRPRIATPTTIDVKVRISREGRVTSASAIQHGEGLIDYLATRAVAAAKQWTFTPASQDGKTIESSQTIRFVFEQ